MIYSCILSTSKKFRTLSVPLNNRQANYAFCLTKFYEFSTETVEEVNKFKNVFKRVAKPKPISGFDVKLMLRPETKLRDLLEACTKSAEVSKDKFISNLDNCSMKTRIDKGNINLSLQEMKYLNKLIESSDLSLEDTIKVLFFMATVIPVPDKLFSDIYTKLTESLAQSTTPLTVRDWSVLFYSLRNITLPSTTHSECIDYFNASIHGYIGLLTKKMNQATGDGNQLFDYNTIGTSISGLRYLSSEDFVVFELFNSLQIGMKSMLHQSSEATNTASVVRSGYLLSNTQLALLFSGLQCFHVYRGNSASKNRNALLTTVEKLVLRSGPRCEVRNSLNSLQISYIFSGFAGMSSSSQAVKGVLSAVVRRLEGDTPYSLMMSPVQISIALRGVALLKNDTWEVVNLLHYLKSLINRGVSGRWSKETVLEVAESMHCKSSEHGGFSELLGALLKSIPLHMNDELVTVPEAWNCSSSEITRVIRGLESANSNSPNVLLWMNEVVIPLVTESTCTLTKSEIAVLLSYLSNMSYAKREVRLLTALLCAKASL